MTENSFPFDQPVDGAAGPAVEEPSERRSPVLLLGGVLGALVLGAGGWFFVTGGDADDEFAAPVTKRPPSVGSPVQPAPEAVVVPVAATEAVGRNPFKALYVPPSGGSTGAPGTTTEGTPATGTGTGATSGAGTGTSGGTSKGAAGGTPTGQAPTAPVEGTTPPEQPKTPPKYLSVQVVDPAANQVTFKLVDRAAAKPEEAEQTVVVKPGEVFATYFKLLGYGTVLDANNNPRNCTDLQYGDALIKLCENESYQVS